MDVEISEECASIRIVIATGLAIDCSLAFGLRCLRRQDARAEQKYQASSALTVERGRGAGVGGKEVDVCMKGR